MSTQSKKLRSVWLLTIVLSLLLTFSCTKEKAEAIKVAAERFRMEAVLAIQKINALFLQSVSIPVESNEAEIKKIATELDMEQAFDANKLSTLIHEKDFSKSPQGKINQEFESIAKRYYQFEAMFRSLPQGSLLAKDAGKRAERHAINLTIDLIHYAEFLKDYPVQFTGRRTLIVEKISEVKQIQNPEGRKGFLTMVAGDILQLRNDEESAKREAIVQCLKAAESGKLISDLIRNYSSMSIDDILASLRGTLGFFTEITGGDQGLVSLLNRYKSIESTIREDPYWSEMLEVKLTK
jgi:hypothetical protein